MLEKERKIGEEKKMLLIWAKPQNTVLNFNRLSCLNAKPLLRSTRKKSGLPFNKNN